MRKLAAAALIVVGMPMAAMAGGGSYLTFSINGSSPTDFAKFDPTGMSASMRVQGAGGTATYRFTFDDVQFRPVTGAVGALTRYIGGKSSGRDDLYLIDFGFPYILAEITYSRFNGNQQSAQFQSVDYNGTQLWNHDFDIDVRETGDNSYFIGKQGNFAYVQMTNLGTTTIAPLSGFTQYVPRALNADGRVGAFVNKGSTSSADLLEIIDTRPGGYTYTPVTGFSEAIALSASGNTVLARTTGGGWYLVNWSVVGSPLIELLSGGASRVYPCGITRDGRMAFGGINGAAGTIPNTGVIWGPDGTQLNAKTAFNNAGAGIPASITIRCVTDIASDGRKALAIYEEAGNLGYMVLNCPRPIVLPGVRFRPQVVSPPGSGAVTLNGVNMQGVLAGYRTVGTVNTPFIQSTMSAFTFGGVNGFINAIDENERAYGSVLSGSSTAAMHFGPGATNQQLTTFGTGFVNSVSGNGGISGGYATNTDLPAGGAAVWVNGNAASIERPFGPGSGGTINGVDRFGNYLGGSNPSNQPVALLRFGVNVYNRVVLPTSSGVTGSVHATNVNAFNFPLFAGIDAGGVQVWAPSTNTLGAGTTATRYSTGVFGTPVGLQSYGGAQPSIADIAGLAIAINGSAPILYTNTHGSSRIIDIMEDVPNVRPTSVKNMTYNGRICGSNSGGLGYWALPITQVRGFLNLQGYSDDKAAPSRFAAIYARQFPSGTSPLQSNFGATVSESRALAGELAHIGKADLIVKYAHFLSEDTWDLNFGAGEGLADQFMTLVNGDVNQDDEVGPGDLQIVLDWFGSSSGWPVNQYPDLDGDGEVGPGDLQIVLDNFGLQGVL